MTTLISPAHVFHYRSSFTRDLDRKPTSLGRDTGWQLKNGGTIENEALYTWSATHGRLSQISNPQISNLQFTYNYVLNSNLIATVTSPAHTVTNTWDPTRDALLVKDNRLSGPKVLGKTTAWAIFTFEIRIHERHRPDH